MYQPRLVQALDAAKRDVERARAEEAEATAREEAKAGRRATTGRESGSLQSSTVKYIRDKISAEQFHEEMLRTMKRGGKVEEAVVAKVARGMPEDKSWALMDAHRKWKRAERLNKTSFRESRRAKVASKEGAGSGEVSAERGGRNDR